MSIFNEFNTFAKNHYYLSLATLGLAPLLGVLGSRTIRYITNYLFPGAQEVDAVARNALRAHSFEKDLNEWLNAPNTTGNKTEAARRIRDAYTNKSVSLSLDHLNLNSLPTVIGQLRVLTALNVSYNELANLPTAIGQLTALSYLNVFGNQLTDLPPEVGELTALRQLSVGNNRLTALPAVIRQLSALVVLGVSKNRLTDLPAEIRQLNALAVLNVSDNQLRALPVAIRELSTLRSLNVSNNQLTNLPIEIGQFTTLTHLAAFGNQLTGLPPQIGQLRALTELDVYNNSELSELPISLGDIPGITHIDISGTQIPAAIVQSILASCRTKRNRHPGKILPSRLTLWKRISGKEFDSTHILNLEDAHKNNISEWLLRLSRTSDFGSGSQKELAEKACAMMEALRDYPEFKSFFLGQILGNNGACGDRAAQGFNELYCAYKINTMNKDAPLKDKLELIQGCAKTLQLRESIRMCIKAHQEAGNPQVREDVQIYLHYETAFREELGLLTAINSMFYRDIGRRKWINETTLKEDVQKNYIRLMGEMAILREIALQDVDLRNAKNVLDESFQQGMDELDPEKLSDMEYTTRGNELKNDTEKALTNMYVNWIKLQLDIKEIKNEAT